MENMNMDKGNDNSTVQAAVSGKKVFMYYISKWWVFLLLGAAFGLMGITYAWLKDPKYTAEMTFTTDLEKGGQLGLSGIAAQFGIDISGGNNSAFEGDNLIELLRSRNIVEKTLLTKSPTSNLLMIEVYLYNHKSKKAIEKDTVLKNIRFEKNPSQPDRNRDSITWDIAKNIIKTNLVIERKDKKLSYMQLRVTDNNEAFAKDFAQLLANNAIDYYVEYKSRKARKNFELLNEQFDSVRNLLYGNIQQIATNTDLNINPLRQVAKTSNQKQQLNATANTALYTELIKQLGLARVNLYRETPLIQIIDAPKLPLKKEKPGRFFMGLTFAFIGTFLSILLMGFRYWKRASKNTLAIA